MCAPALSPPISSRSEPSSAAACSSSHTATASQSSCPLGYECSGAIRYSGLTMATLHSCAIRQFVGSLLARLPIMNAPPWIER